VASRAGRGPIGGRYRRAARPAVHRTPKDNAERLTCVEAMQAAGLTRPGDAWGSRQVRADRRHVAEMMEVTLRRHGPNARERAGAIAGGMGRNSATAGASVAIVV